MMCVLVSFPTELVLEGCRGLVTLLRSPVLCVEQGCVHWCLCSSVGCPSPSHLALGHHSTPGERQVEGAAGRPKDRLPKAQHRGVPGVGTVWPRGRGVVLGVPGGQQCSPSPGMVPPHTLLQPLGRVSLTCCCGSTQPSTPCLCFLSPHDGLHCCMCQHPAWGADAALLPALSSALQSAGLLITLC